MISTLDWRHAPQDTGVLVDDGVKEHRNASSVAVGFLREGADKEATST